METLCAEEEEASARNGNPPSVATPSVVKKPGKKAVLPAKKKGKGQAKLRRRTVNPKKVKKNDRVALLNDEDSLSDGQQELDGRTGERKGSASRHAPRKVVSSAHVQSQGSVSESSGEASGIEDVGKEDDEQEWNKLQQSLSKHSKKKFEQKPTESHPVHAPYFPEVTLNAHHTTLLTPPHSMHTPSHPPCTPHHTLHAHPITPITHCILVCVVQEKCEVWWLYVVDRKKRAMTCLPMKIAGLMTEYTVGGNHHLLCSCNDRPISFLDGLTIPGSRTTWSVSL